VGKNYVQEIWVRIFSKRGISELEIIVLNDPGITPGYVYHDSASAPPVGSYIC